MTHVFTYYSDHELAGLTADELAHLELVDRVLSKDRDIDPLEAERMTDDALRAILGERTTELAPPVAVVAPVAVADIPAHLVGQPDWAIRAWQQRDAAVAGGRLPTRKPSHQPSYPAKVWSPALGRMVHIGVFPTIEARDAAVTDAKARRALGLPIKPTGPTNGH